MLISTLRHMRLVGSVLLVIAAALSVANTVSHAKMAVPAFLVSMPSHTAIRTEPIQSNA